MPALLTFNEPPSPNSSRSRSATPETEKINRIRKTCLREMRMRAPFRLVYLFIRQILGRVNRGTSCRAAPAPGRAAHDRPRAPAGCLAAAPPGPRSAARAAKHSLRDRGRQKGPLAHSLLARAVIPEDYVFNSDVPISAGQMDIGEVVGAGLQNFRWDELMHAEAFPPVSSGGGSYVKVGVGGGTSLHTDGSFAETPAQMSRLKYIIAHGS